jgi:type IV pilus assembly protein PilQ
VDKPKPLIPDIVKLIRLYNVPPTEVIDLVAQPDLIIKAFDNTQLYLSGQQVVVDKVSAVIALMDKPKKQYMVKAKLIATSDVFMENLGVTLNAAVNSQHDNSSLSSAFTTAATVATGGTALIVHKAGSVLLSTKVNAAISDGDASVISEPQTMAYDNKESSITQGLRIPYQTQLPQGGYSVAFVDAALALKVTPRRGDDKDRIIIDVYFSKNSAGAQSSAGVEIETREIKTTIALRSGETVLLGGIDESSKDSSDSGIPYLRDIPILGYAFGSKLDNAKHNKIILMLTPTMIN